MNKSKRLLVGIIALSAVILFSCNNLAGGKVVEKGDNPAVSDKTTLTISIDEMLTSAQSPSARNIMPSSWTSEKASALKYKLTGSKTSGGANEITSNNTFTYEQLHGGTAKILLDSTTWYLKLTAYTDSGYSIVALESTEQEVVLSSGTASATFALKVPDSTTATGTAEITVEFTKPGNFGKVTYGIYDVAVPTTDASHYIGTPLTKQTSDLTTVNETTGLYSVVYSDTSITAGIYYFNAAFYDAASPNPNIICFYSDKIQIDGGNDTTKTITISGNAFNKPAANPTAISVAYSYNDTTFAEMKADELTSTGTLNDKFYATFTWDDNSDNETGFELVITDNADTEHPVTYNATSNTPTSGALTASSTTAIVELITGHVYTAKIRAVNNFTTATTYTELTGNVNLFTVSYNLNSGRVQKANGSSNTTADTITTYVKPYTSSASTQSLLGNDNTAFPYIFRNSYTFNKWYTTGDTNKTAVTTIAANNTANISLTADWQSELGVSITLPEYSTIDDYALVSTYSEAAVYEVEATLATTVTLTPNTGLTGATWTIYDTDYTSSLETGKAVDDTTKVLTWTISSIPAGTYRIAVAGTKDGTAVTGNIYIKIKR